MKKLFAAILLIINLNVFGQASKWFVSMSVTPTLSGPSVSLRKQIIQQGYDQTSTFNFFGLTGSTNYPVVRKSPSVLFRGGKNIDHHRSIYFTAGIASRGEVEGFKNEGYSDFWGIFGGSTGESVTIHYCTYQLTAGCMYSFKNTVVKLGLGPSLFLLNYKMRSNFQDLERHNAIVPGATFTAKVPLGRERKLVGMELVFEGNIAPPAAMQSNSASGFQPKRVNLASANIGLAISFRR